jgi:hypothetical protein
LVFLPGSVRVRALFAHIDSVCRRFFFGFLLFLWPEILLPALNFSWPAPASHLKWKGSGDGYRSFQKKKSTGPFSSSAKQVSSGAVHAQVQAPAPLIKLCRDQLSAVDAEASLWCPVTGIQGSVGRSD